MGGDVIERHPEPGSQLLWALTSRAGPPWSGPPGRPDPGGPRSVSLHAGILPVAAMPRSVRFCPRMLHVAIQHA